MTRTTTLVRTASTVAVALAFVLTGCASPTSSTTDRDAATTESRDSFPISIDHAYGQTTIATKPVRVATVAWSNQEVPLALGIVPVGMAKVTWGDDNDNGVYPWVEDALEELDAETPVLFDETDGIDFEAVADTAPDVILAAYSGLTQEDYDTLSKIAPVVAYPEFAWSTSMQDMIRLNSAALGLAQEGDALIAELEQVSADALSEFPQLAESTVLFSYVDPNDFSQIGFYTTHDTRPGFLVDLGMAMPSIVLEESATTEEFYTSVSSEEADRFGDVDIFVTYGDAGSDILTQLQQDPLLGQIPAIAQGQVAILENGTPLASSANPSPLSIGWGVEKYFTTLAGALG